ncbi:hypothetical protein Bbelb_408140 [Branchiostoma belcheri]|nr:hypothetical protein Bbelb_408140 [Branchiostoma belcheri]
MCQNVGRVYTGQHLGSARDETCVCVSERERAHLETCSARECEVSEFIHQRFSTGERPAYLCQTHPAGDFCRREVIPSPARAREPSGELFRTSTSRTDSDQPRERRGPSCLSMVLDKARFWDTPSHRPAYARYMYVSGGTAVSAAPVYEGVTAVSAAPVYQGGTAVSAAPVYQGGIAVSAAPVYQGGTAVSAAPVYQGGTAVSAASVRQGGTAVSAAPVLLLKAVSDV